MAETPQNTKNGDIPCIIVYCENPNGTSCPDTCLPSVDPYFLPPPLPPQPPPLPPPPSSSSHLAPFLIAIVCILGISFLLLTTCTIIFRYRFSRRRHEDRHTVSNINHNHDDDDHSFVDHPIWHITTVGLHQSVIDSITAFKYKKIDGFFLEGSSDTSCSVCLTEFEDGDDLRMLPKCCHPFHQNCIDTWLRSHKNCPLCRAPVVNEGVVVPDADHVVVVSGTLNGGESERMNLSYGSEVSSSSSSSSNRADDITRLPVLEGTKIAEILRRNHELRIFSDLGDHRRFREVEMVDYGVDSVRRSVSFNSMAASAKSGAVIGSSNGGGSKVDSSGEGCSREANFGGVLHQQKKNIDLEKGGNNNNNKRGSSMSGLLIKSSSNGRSLQKSPVSMKRSLSSSSSRFFSFRRSKSQASVLPL